MVLKLKISTCDPSPMRQTPSYMPYWDLKIGEDPGRYMRAYWSSREVRLARIFYFEY